MRIDFLLSEIFIRLVCAISDESLVCFLTLNKKIMM